MATIRPARREEHGDLEGLLCAASLATGEHREAQLDNPDAMQVPIENVVHTLVADLGGRIAGFCTILPLSPTTAEVDAIFVDPIAWRTGIGRTLLNAAEQRIARAGATSLSVVSGLYAQPFYEASGFKRSGVEMTRFGPAVRLTKLVYAT